MKNPIDKTVELWLRVLRTKYPEKKVSRWNSKDIKAELEKMIKLDKITSNQLFDLCSYATADSFWSNNLKSPFQLRAKSKSDGDFKKWEIIRDQMIMRGLWQTKKVKEQKEKSASTKKMYRDVLGGVYE